MQAVPSLTHIAADRADFTPSGYYNSLKIKEDHTRGDFTCDVSLCVEAKSEKQNNVSEDGRVVDRMTRVVHAGSA